MHDNVAADSKVDSPPGNRERFGEPPLKGPVFGSGERNLVVRGLTSLGRLLAVPCTLVVVWAIVSGSGLVSIALIPSPFEVFGKSAPALFKGPEIYEASLSSLSRIAAGWLLAAAFGVLLGLFVGLSPRARLIFDWPVDAGRSLPPAAVVPLVLLWFGIGDTAAISLVVFIAVWPVIINTAGGIRAVPKVQRDAALTLGANRRQLLTTVVLPASANSIVIGLRIAMGLSWMAVVLSELVGVKHGLGALLLTLENNGAIASMLVVIVTIGVLGVTVDWAFRQTTGRFLKWQRTVFVG